jgi:hypothetical protein
LINGIKLSRVCGMLLAAEGSIPCSPEEALRIHSELRSFIAKRVKKDAAVHWMYQCKLRSIILETLAGRDDESKNGKITNEEFHFSFFCLLFIKTIGSTHVSFYSKLKKMTGFHTNLNPPSSLEN